VPLFAPEQADLGRFKARFVWALVLMALAFLALAVRLYKVQMIDGPGYLELSWANFVSIRREVALRGMIYDRTGRLLADNRPSFNLYFTPAFCRAEAFEPTLERLTEYLGLTDEELQRMREVFAGSRRLDRFLPLSVRRGMTWAELAAVEQHLDLLDGVEVRPETQRGYPEGSLAAHLLGYVGEVSPAELVLLREQGYLQGDVVGKAGVEKAWEEQLRGRNGKLRVVVDSRGQRVPEAQAQEILRTQPEVAPAEPGLNLVLSLDARLQALAEARFPGREGAVVALDARTGFLLALMSKPAFDPNLVAGRTDARTWKALVEDLDRPLSNRATQQHFPPGSTFKPFTGLAALGVEDFTPTTREVCAGAMRFGDHLFRCWRGGGHGTIELHRAVVQSCDVFFYRAGIRAGMDRLAQMAWSFGFGSLAGLDACQEVPGIMPDRAWYEKNTRTGFLPGFVVSDAIGQGDVNVTPLQLTLAYAAIGNGGSLWRPQVVLRSERPDGSLARAFGPELRRKVLAPPEHLKLMAEALTGVVNEPGGTAYWRRPQKVAFKVAGKTGTAQVVKQGDDRGRALPYEFKDHAWFVAWAPAEQPIIAVAVLVEHGGHGGSAAAPLVMELITYYLEHLGQVPEAGSPLQAQLPEPGPAPSEEVLPDEEEPVDVLPGALPPEEAATGRPGGPTP
jgi:penicillin-binding protein 2